MAEHRDQPLVEIVIPVHSTTRPLPRAVASALRASRGARPGQCRVTVVAHHLGAEDVRGMLPPEQRAAVAVLECEDRGTTAAVPRNEVLRRTRARYISFLDSDDTLDPGAVSRWLGIAERRGSDLVMPFQHRTGTRVDVTPMLRPLRRSRLHPVKDRLGYRSSGFGLVRVSTVRGLGASFDECVPTGEDQAFIMALYAGGCRIDYAPGVPGYLMHSDADVRVSLQPLPLRDEVAAALDAGSRPGVPLPSEALRGSYALKYFRVNFFPALEGGVRSGRWDEERSRDAAATAEELAAVAPHVLDRLSRADRRVLRLLDAGAPSDELLAALRARRRFASLPALLTESPRWVLDRQSPLRVVGASGIQMLRYRVGRRGHAASV